jgi:hypothetical protein
LRDRADTIVRRILAHGIDDRIIQLAYDPDATFC